MFRYFLQDYLMMLFLVVIIVAIGSDIVADISYGASTTHLFQETTILLIAFLMLCWLILDNFLNRRQIRRLNHDIQQITVIPTPESETLLAARHQLRQAITEQFKDWQLTSSEKDVGQMLLKGYSLKEIAVLRGTAEKTTRQQASSIYHKAGLPGRHAFSAWFIEDLL